MSGRRSTDRRGLTVVELMLAMSITAMVAVAIAGMLGAVTAGVMTQRDSRSVMIRANAARARLSAYLAPCRSLLALEGNDELVLWLKDSRESGTVHATEVRWLVFDEPSGTLQVYFVEFPQGWTQTAKDLEDQEYGATTNWSAVRTAWEGRGMLASRPLVDGLDSLEMILDGLPVQRSRHVTFRLGIATSDGPQHVTLSATLRRHQPPEES